MKILKKIKLVKFISYLSNIICFTILCLSPPVLAIDAPSITVQTSGVNVSISWSPVTTATGYTLLYAPYPYSGPNSIEAINMGTYTRLSVDLWTGAAFYVTVIASSDSENSIYSNIELIQISLPPDVPNTSYLSGCYAPNNSGWLSFYCFDASGWWYLETWTPFSGCSGAIESGRYQIQSNSLSICDNTGCDSYPFQATNSGILLGEDFFSESNSCN